MRIWSVHPRFLDGKGLVACWRETLLAQAVLAGRTRGYRQHPQLMRFRDQPDPDAAIGAYLTGLADEADARGYRFDRSRIDRAGEAPGSIAVTDGQLACEWHHLLAKLAVRDPEREAALGSEAAAPHPLFRLVAGGVEPWERTAAADPDRRGDPPLA